MADIRTVRLPGGEEVTFDQWQHWPCYSTLEAAAAVGVDARVFTYTRGQRIPATAGIAPRNSTNSDTNQVTRARMNADEGAVVYSMTYEIFALTDAPVQGGSTVRPAVDPLFSGTNMRRLQRDILLGLYIGPNPSKPSAHAPLSWFPQGIGPAAFASGDALAVPGGGATVGLDWGLAGGVANPGNQRRFQMPLIIEGDTPFYARWYAPGGVVEGLTQDYGARIYLDGLKRRGS